MTQRRAPVHSAVGLGTDRVSIRRFSRSCWPFLPAVVVVLVVVVNCN